MQYFPAALQDLTEQFGRLPGIGGKTAQRLAFHVLSLPVEDAQAFADAIVEAKRTVHTCPVCQNLTDKEICGICDDESRDTGIICVVADPKDVIAMERSREFSGVYHVLHGVISPLDNIGPAELCIKELIDRLKSDEIKEVILATSPTVEGDTTALYIAKLIKPLGVSVTRLAYGIPVGSDLEYADELTLSKAIENRREV